MDARSVGPTRVFLSMVAVIVFVFCIDSMVTAADRPGESSSESKIESVIDQEAPALTVPGAGMPDKSTQDTFDSSAISLAPAHDGDASATTGPTTTIAPDTSANELLLAPIPSYKPTFGFGIQAVVGYLFRVDPNDKVSPPSSIAFVGYGSQNQSWLAGVGGRFFLKEDQYRLVGGVFTGRINYDFSGVGTSAGESGQSVPLEQKVSAVVIEPLTRVIPHLYVGPRIIYADMRASVHLPTTPEPITPPEVQRDSTMSSIALHLQYDSRDAVFYPRKGILSDLFAEFHDPAWGDDFSYQVYKFSYNQYISLAERQVLAVRAAAQVTAGNVPFYSLATIGRGPDLRGYEYGQFQDKTLIAVQAEYRLELTRRFGAVAFAGVGEVAPSLSDYSFDNLLPSIGAGLRYVLAEKNHVSLRLDYGYGREGGKVYFTVGEAF